MADLGIEERLAAHPFLADTLQAFVPLRMDELRALPPDDLAALARQLQHADEVLFGGPHCGEETGALITTLAVLALTAEGGVTVAGLHWCGASHEGCPSRPVWAHLGEYPLPRLRPVPTWRSSGRRGRRDVYLPGDGPAS